MSEQYKSLPLAWRQIIAARLDNGTGVWKDYNSAWKYRKNCEQMVYLGLLKPEDLPPIPDPDDYTNNDAPPTDTLG